MLALRIAALVLAQTVHLANQRQGFFRALVSLYHLAALRLHGQERHAAFDGRHTVGGDAAHHLGAALAVAPAAIDEVGDIFGFGRLADNHMRTGQRFGVGTAHCGMDRARVERAQGAGNIAHRRKEFVFRAGQRVFDHQSAAVVGIVQAFGGVKLQVLFGQSGVFAGHG